MPKQDPLKPPTLLATHKHMYHLILRYMKHLFWKYRHQILSWQTFSHFRYNWPQLKKYKRLERNRKHPLDKITLGKKYLRFRGWRAFIYKKLLKLLNNYTNGQLDHYARNFIDLTFFNLMETISKSLVSHIKFADIYIKKNKKSKFSIFNNKKFKKAKNIIFNSKKATSKKKSANKTKKKTKKGYRPPYRTYDSGKEPYYLKMYRKYPWILCIANACTSKKLIAWGYSLFEKKFL